MARFGTDRPMGVSARSGALQEGCYAGSVPAICSAEDWMNVRGAVRPLHRDGCPKLGQSHRSLGGGALAPCSPRQ
ncbi:hypothetical protein CBM2598_P100017 [Cupriavidus taiwanensis]|uniref:Uncharacterized protein n=1 Tax=Cupriavidus taiwanensis TaxID=164546 RepID=A0A7Z7JF85_9BURK|nr:hypothetical protein CBM2597_P110018 [Cupriavidus taiwanensis]SOZ95020.1 hypothetical protein CBM2598_P100017 [Cupriavidus taiwanensis]SPC25493.1 hypothetical protein CBM2594_P80018 [Cupriavidus taiwanensis]